MHRPLTLCTLICRGLGDCNALCCAGQSPPHELNKSLTTWARCALLNNMQDTKVACYERKFIQYHDIRWLNQCTLSLASAENSFGENRVFHYIQNIITMQIN